MSQCVRGERGREKGERDKEKERRLRRREMANHILATPL